VIGGLWEKEGGTKLAPKNLTFNRVSITDVQHQKNLYYYYYYYYLSNWKSNNTLLLIFVKIVEKKSNFPTCAKLFIVSTIIGLSIQNILLLLTFVKIVENQTSQLVQSYLLSQPFIGLLLEFYYYY